MGPFFFFSFSLPLPPEYHLVYLMTRPHILSAHGRQHYEEIKSMGRAALQTLSGTDDDSEDSDYRKPIRTRLQHWKKEKKAKLRPTRTLSEPYMQYALTMAKNLALTLYFNWTMVFYAPLSALATVVVYPTFMVALLLIELLLKLFMDVLGGEKLILYWAHRYGKGNNLRGENSQMTW